MITWTQWTALDGAGRSVWLDQLLELLPPWLSLVDPVAPLPLFRDGRYAQRFALVPGATVTLGVTPERARSVAEVLARAPLQLFSPEVALPARTVSVPAHFAALDPMRIYGETWLVRSPPRSRAVWRDPSVPDDGGLEGLLAAVLLRSWRLPSEAEWEVHYREVHPRLELPSLTAGELCLDDWHRGYEGAPSDGSPWGQGAELVRVASTSPLDVRHVVPGRLPLRSIGGACVRPVIDLPRGQGPGGPWGG